MSTVTIRLDKSRAYSTAHGERQTDDPHYRVAYSQNFKHGKTTVQLHFDSQGVLVPDDGRTEPYVGTVDGKPITYQPLYTKEMRDFVAKLKERASGPAQPEEASANNMVGDTDPDPRVSAADEVNLETWLRGEAKYEWPALQAACKERFHRRFESKKQMVEDLVIDEKLVPENEVCAEFKKYLPAIAAA